MQNTHKWIYDLTTQDHEAHYPHWCSAINRNTKEIAKHSRRYLQLIN